MMDRWQFATRIALAAFGLGAVGAAAWTSVHVVEPNETGVIRAFGAVTTIVPPGMHLTLPWPVGELVRVNTSSIDRISVGFRLFEREIGLSPPEDMVQWLTGDRNIVEIEALVAYTIVDPRKFLYSIADRGEEGWLVLAESQRTVVRRAAEAAITRTVARMSIDELLTYGKAQLQAAVVPSLQTMLDTLDSGIAVSSLQIQSVSPPKLVIESFNQVQSDRSYRDKQIAEADGYVRDNLPRARGTANSVLEQAAAYDIEERARAAGVVARFESVRAEAEKSRSAVMTRLWVDSVKKVLSRTRKIVVPASPPGAPPQKIILETDGG
jgi:modulator of FtsH protease HflK